MPLLQLPFVTAATQFLAAQSAVGIPGQVAPDRGNCHIELAHCSASYVPWDTLFVVIGLAGFLLLVIATAALLNWRDSGRYGERQGEV